MDFVSEEVGACSVSLKAVVFRCVDVDLRKIHVSSAYVRAAVKLAAG